VDAKNPQNCPLEFCPTPAYFPDYVSFASPFQMTFTNFVADSAFYVVYSENQLNQIITQEMIPSWSPINLNTSTWHSNILNYCTHFCKT
jgi:hypothetical protein